jgi:hypothetical protein
VIEKLTNVVAPFATCTRSKSRSWRAGVGTTPPRCGGTMYLHHIGASSVRMHNGTNELLGFQLQSTQVLESAMMHSCHLLCETYACSTSSLSIRPTFTSFRSTVNGFILIGLLSLAESTTGAG